MRIYSDLSQRVLSPARRGFLQNAAISVLGTLIPGTGFAAPLETASKTPVTGSWEKNASMPAKVQEIYAAILHDKIHVAGGFLQTGGTLAATARHFAFDPARDAWCEKAPLTGSRHHPQLVAHAGKLFALGGYQAQSMAAVWGMRNQTWIFDPANDKWRDGAPAPEKHAETVAASLAGNIHIVGGRVPKGDSNQSYRDHADSRRHLVFDPQAQIWTSAAPAPTARNSAACAVIDGELYVVGGRTMAGGNVAALEIYNPREDKWRSGAKMPQSQAGLAAVASGGKLYAFGGEYFDASGGGVFAECWQYDPARDVWEAAPPMATPRHGLAGVALDGWIYSIGGAVNAGGSGTSNLIERFKPTVNKVRDASLG